MSQPPDRPSISRQLVDLQPHRAASIAVCAEKSPLDRAEQRILAIAPDQAGRLDHGMMRAILAPGAQRVPLAQVAEGHIQPRVHAPLDDGLRRQRRLTGREDLLHDMAAVVVDQQHSRPAPDGRLPRRLAHA